MRSKAIAMALLAFAFQAQAVPVSQEQAELAARAWVVRGETLGVAFGQYVDESSAHETQYGDAFYTVKMYGSGMVIMSADTDVEPVLAFMPSSDIDSALADGSPLRALLEQDLSARRKLKSSASLASVAADSSGVSSKWRDLIAEGAALEARPRFLSDAASPISANPGDLRVAKIVQSEWSQSQARGKNCYNHYTPKNYVCGCVATALAQLMRYHHGPKTDGGRGIPLPRNPVEQLTRKCSVDGVSKNLTMAGGTYDWVNMPLCPAKMSGLTETQCQAIGKLTSDVGIAHCMSYTSDESGAYSPEHAATLVQVFGYKQAVVLWDKTRLSGDGIAVRKAMFSNFDVACPVTLSIRGAGGHSIVADGYGYNANVPYVHLNMGWAGTDDMWYNLPHLEDIGYTVVEDVTYNAFPDQGSLTTGGAATVAVLSGRTLDEDGKPVGGCRVSVFRQGETEDPVYEGVTSARGVWGAILPAGTYDVTAVSEDGQWRGEKDNILLKAPAAAYESWVNYKVPVVRDVDKVGNSWGNDMTLSSPKVQIVVDDVTNSYSRLDRAIAGARDLVAANPGLVPVLEILSDVGMKGVLTVDFPCVIRSKDGPFAVTRAGGSAFEVATGFSLALENVTFSESAETLVEVAAGGSFVLGAGVEMGVAGDDAVSVRTADATGFTLAAVLSRGFAIDCAAAHDVGASFGTVEGLTSEDAAASAAKIVNIHDTFGEVRGMVDVDGVTLLWGEVPVPLDEAVGYYVGADGATNTAARLDRLFPKFMNALNDGTVGDGHELVVLKSGTLSCGPFTNGCDITVRGFSGTSVGGESGSTTGFVVTNGTLTVRDLTFEGFSGGPFVIVDGENAGFTLGHGAKLLGIDCKYGKESPVTVRKGRCTIGETAAIVGCRSTGGSGGGVNLRGAGCSLVVNGGMVSNCHAYAAGGGVFAGKESVVRLSGAAVVCDNTSGNAPSKADDVYLDYRVRIALDAPVIGGRVGILSSEAAVNKLGGVFTAESPFGGNEFEATAKTFFNDIKPAFVAAVDGRSLKWSEAVQIPAHQPLDPSEADRASARIVNPDGSTVLWESLQWALEALSNRTDSAVVEVLQDGMFDADITIRANLTIRSVGGPWTFARCPGVGITVVDGASLVVSNLIFKGVYADADAPSEKPLVKVSNGSKLVLGSGAVIEGVRGKGARDAGAVTVWNGSTFRMEDDAVIRGCTNLYVNAGEGAGNSGGVLVDNRSVAFLYGGEIVDCAAYRAGGVSVANESFVHIGGSMSVSGNASLDGEVNNLLVHANSSLVLDAKLDGDIGYVEGVKGDRAKFGVVSAAYGGTDAELAGSAHRFTHDTDGDVGFAVRNGDETIFVWSNALKADGTYAEGDKVYRLVAGDVKVPTQAVAIEGLVYTGGQQVGLAPGHGFVATGDKGTDAGDYTAIVTLKDGFAWSDGVTARTREIPWKIAKAQVIVTAKDQKKNEGDEDPELTYGVAGLQGTDRAENVLTGKLARVVGEEVGFYEILQGTLAVVEGNGNYELAFIGARLEIVGQPVPPPPPPPVPETNDPTPIAFQSIRFDTDAGEWVLVATNGVKDCWYSLWGGTELKLNERGLIGTEVVPPEQANADGPVIFRVAVPDTDRQWFWRALAEPGEVRP